jgi:O-antigen ligase
MFLVALCFRRTYWAELAIGVALLAMTVPGRRLRTLALPLCMTLVAFLALGTSFTQRLSSIDFTRDDVPYSEDNSDHVGDVLDAWAQVRAAPLMGIGLGTAYPTWHIRNWKQESVMVHNAPLHVWLKYGLLGLALYLAYHLSLFRELRMHGKRSPPQHRAIVSAVLAYLAAQFLVCLGFTPWPYSAVQSTNLIAFLLAVAFIREPLCHSPAFPLSPRPSTAPPIWKTPSSA